MKTLISLLTIMLLPVTLFATIPEKLTYQAVIRNSTNILVTNQLVGMRISIVQGSAIGTVVYSETHTPTSNINGLITITIGEGVVVSGTFSSVDWSAGPYFIKTEVDPAGGTNYTITVDSELLSVPYALHAKTADSFSIPQWTLSDNHIYYNNGNVGIGVSNPSSNLDVRGSNPDLPGIISLGNYDLSHRMVLFGGRENDPNPYINWKQGDPLRFTTDEGGWSEKMRITSDGKVGIVTSNPATYIHAHGAPVTSRGQLSLSSPTGQGTFISFYEADLFKAYLWFDVSDQDLRLQNFTAGDLNLNPYGGNVGIGTNTPTTRLDVAGEINVNNNKIQNVADPENAQDAATKAYVDALFARIESLEVLVNGFTDSRDGNHYKLVKIGNQIWMSENLKYLPSVTGPGIGTSIIPYYYVNGYDGNSVTDAKATVNYKTYGVLYNWEAARTSCPVGWHIPTDAEWTQLSDYLGGAILVGEKLKETGETHWIYPNRATNETGFTALPGGARYDNGTFGITLGSYGYWWSATEYSINNAWYREILSIGYLVRNNFSKEEGLSVRCIRD